MSEKKLRDIVPDYAEWVADAKAPESKFKGIPINTMSADDLMCVIAVLNHICHEQADRMKQTIPESKAGRLWTPPGFGKKG